MASVTMPTIKSEYESSNHGRRHSDTPEEEYDSDSRSPSPDGSDSESEDDSNEGQGGTGRRRGSGSGRTRKKGQKFQCTGFGDCVLTFTRSEHLSRHIRKHTGEKPYQCFCKRAFSRLDNLRQHAYTVHDPSEIPPNWEHNSKGRSKAPRKKEHEAKKVKLRQRQTKVGDSPRGDESVAQDSSVTREGASRSATSCSAVSVRTSSNSIAQSESLTNGYQKPINSIPLSSSHMSSLSDPQIPTQQYMQQPVQPPHQRQRSDSIQSLHSVPTASPIGYQGPHRHHHSHSYSYSEVPAPQQLQQPQMNTFASAQVHHHVPNTVQYPLNPQLHPQLQQQPHYAQPMPPPHIQPQQTMYHPDQQPHARHRPQPLSLPINGNIEGQFHDYRSNSPPHSPVSTPHTPRGPYPYPNGSGMTTPTSMNPRHRHSASYGGPHTPSSAGWETPNRRLSMGGGVEYSNAPRPRPVRDAAEIEENRRKRMTWHAGAEEDRAINGIVVPMEQTHLDDDPRPRTRQRASTYLPQALPSVDSLLNFTTPRTLPPLGNQEPQWAQPQTMPMQQAPSPVPIQALQPPPSPHIGPTQRMYGGESHPVSAAARRRIDHNRSRSASHIVPGDGYPNGPRSIYSESLAEQRGKRRSTLINQARGPNGESEPQFSPQYQHMRRDSVEGIAPPRPIEPSLSNRNSGSFTFGQKDQPYSDRRDPGMIPRREPPTPRRQPAGGGFVFPPPAPPSRAPSNGSTHRPSGLVNMEDREAAVFGDRPASSHYQSIGTVEMQDPSKRPIPLEFLASVCDRIIHNEDPAATGRAQ